jgi:short-subunit dehydrogenase
MSNTDEFAKVGLAPRGEQLKGKWALITGASRGVGWTIAEKFASEGANLILVARSADSLEKLAAELKGKAGEIDIIPTDMSDSAAIDDLAKKVLEKYGGVDILVNNAGILAANGDSPLEGDPDEWDKLFKLNLSAPLRLTRRLAPSLVERKGGAIINTGSMAAVAANPEQCSYVATKHALLGFSISAFEVLRHHGIKVCIINPAYINSSMTSVRTDAYFDKMIYPADVAEAAMLVIRTSFNCCPTQIWLQNNPDIIHHD